MTLTRSNHLQVMESSYTLEGDVVVQTWFIRDGNTITRTELYFHQCGSVVAFQDCINGENQPLQMDMMFKVLYEGETAFESILQHSGVHDPSKIQIFSTGR